MHTHSQTLFFGLLKSSLIDDCVDEGKIWLKVWCTEAFRDNWVLQCAAGKTNMKCYRFVINKRRLASLNINAMSFLIFHT